MSEQANLIRKIDELKAKMPDFVLEYYNSKLSIPFSFKTLYAYLGEFDRFFSWVKSEGIADEITLDVMEHFKKVDMESYKGWLFHRANMNYSNNTKATLSKNTVNRSMSALASLWNYLARETEDEHGEPYFYRNVMDKIQVSSKKKETLSSRANNFKGQLFKDEESYKFLEYIENEYPLKLSPRATTFFEKNKERDLAIIALIFATGLRLSEVKNIDMKDINLKVGAVDVIRKGDKADHVMIAPSYIDYIKQYADIRQSRYNPDKHEHAFFLTTYRGKAQRITGNTIEQLVGKYSDEFKTRVSPHKLRHSMATTLYEKTNDLSIVATQLGHTSTKQVTDLYVNLDDEQQRQALDKL
jgi:integrase